MGIRDRIKRIRDRFKGNPEERSEKNFETALEYFKTGKTKEAAEFFNKAISQGYMGNTEDETKTAIECYDEILTEDPENYTYLNFKGELLTELEKHQEAIECFDKALELNPTDFRSLRDKGRSLSELAIFDEALKSYDSAISINPEDSQTYIERGNVLLSMGNRIGAIDSYDKSMRTKKFRDVDAEKIWQESEKVSEQIKVKNKLKKKSSWRNPKAVREMIKKGGPVFLAGVLKFFF